MRIILQDTHLPALPLSPFSSFLSGEMQERSVGIHHQRADRNANLSLSLSDGLLTQRCVFSRTFSLTRSLLVSRFFSLYPPPFWRPCHHHRATALYPLCYLRTRSFSFSIHLFLSFREAARLYVCEIHWIKSPIHIQSFDSLLLRSIFYDFFLFCHPSVCNAHFCSAIECYAFPFSSPSLPAPLSLTHWRSFTLPSSRLFYSLLTTSHTHTQPFRHSRSSLPRFLPRCRCVLLSTAYDTNPCPPADSCTLGRPSTQPIFFNVGQL